MYNMEISIGSYKCRLEICILAFVLFWIMFGHVLCSCCTMSMQEGFNMLKESYIAAPRARRAYYNTTEGFVTAPVAKKRVYDNNNTTEETTTEGFVGSNNKAYGPEFQSSKSPGYIMRPDTWAMPTLSYSKGTVPSAGAEAILNRNNPPLAEGEMAFFANTPFKPECCPNTFSSSEGCACMDMQQYGTLIHRGGNNVPYDIY
jgi:hypothetical protein